MYSFKGNPPWTCCPRSPCRCGNTQILPGRWEALLFLKSSFRNDITRHLRTFMVRKCFLTDYPEFPFPILNFEPFSQSPRGTREKLFVQLKLLTKLFLMIIPLIECFLCHILYTYSLLCLPKPRGVYCLPSVQRRTEYRDEVQERLSSNWWRQDLNLRSCLISVHQL